MHETFLGLMLNSVVSLEAERRAKNVERKKENLNSITSLLITFKTLQKCFLKQ